MEIDITSFVEDEDAYEFSASIAERGANAGPETWRNAKDQGEKSPMLTTPEQLDVLREYVKGFGAWEHEEIDNWSETECNALFIQLVSGDMREAGMADYFIDEFDWALYAKRAEQGQISGNIYRGDDGRVYYYLGM